MALMVALVYALVEGRRPNERLFWVKMGVAAAPELTKTLRSA